MRGFPPLRRLAWEDVRRDTCKMGHVVNKYCRMCFSNLPVVRQGSVGMSIIREKKISLILESYALPTMRS